MPFKIWNIGRVSIYPHLEFPELYTLEQLQHIAKELAQALSRDGLKICVFPESSYCCEVNGTWNVVIGFRKPDDDYLYTYMIRRDTKIGKSYGCPFENSDYIWDSTKHDAFLSKYCPKEFGLVDTYLKEKLGGTEITTFPT
jgi:hypothetical protein